MVLILIRLIRAWRERGGVASPDAGNAAAIAAPASILAGSQSRSARRAAASGPLALLAHQIHFDLLASLRNPRARFFTIIFPIVLLVILASVFGHGTTIVDGVQVKLSRFYVPGILAMSIITTDNGSLRRRIRAISRGSASSR